MNQITKYLKNHKLRAVVKRWKWLHRPKPFFMFDAVTVSNIPKDAVAVAGYVNGRWRTFPTIVKQFPKAKHLSIAVTVEADADCLDIENGDAHPSQAALWVKRQIRRGVKRPVVYSSVSIAKEVKANLKAYGVKRSQYRIWTAHYTYKPHRCSRKCGFGFFDSADATQFTNRARAKSLDQSLCKPNFL